MTLFERVSELAKKQGLSVFDLAEKLKLSRNSVYSWKKSSPKAETLQKVADYFNVSVDYLLGRTENSASQPNNLTDMEKELLMRFRKGEKEVSEDKKALYQKQTMDLMDFITKTMNELDEKNK